MFFLRIIRSIFRPRTTLRFGRTYMRNHRAMIAVRASLAPRTLVLNASRTRRGTYMVLLAAWRRTDIGSNHITSYGVWRIGARRAAIRINRSGETRWHRPHRCAA